MPRRKLLHDRAAIRASFKLAEDLGKKVAQLKLNPDGSWRLIFAENLTAAAATQPDDWDENLSHG
jgi:hypothetical protein